MSKLSQARRLFTIGDVATAIAAAGTSAATATVLPADFCSVTSATEGSADGVIMKPGNAVDFRLVSNNTSAAIKIYPPTGCQFNGATANAALTLPPNMAAFFLFLTSSQIATTAGF